MKTRLALFAVAAILAPLGDYGHITQGVSTYFWAPGPLILCSPLWFVALCGFFAASLGDTLLRLRPKWGSVDQNVSSAKTKIHALGVPVAMMVIYFSTALLPREYPWLEAMGLLLVGFLLWLWIGRAKLALFAAVFAAVNGTLGEIVITWLGAFSYEPRLQQLFGVAPWLPALYFPFGLAVYCILEWLEPRRKNERSR